MSKTGINAFDLSSQKPTAEDFLKAEEMIKMNYGSTYNTQKFNLLWEVVREAGWSKLRLHNTVIWFLKNKKYPNWTIADWFEYDIKLFPYTWVQEEVHKNRDAMKYMEIYKVNKTILFRYKDGNELPFEKLI